MLFTLSALALIPAVLSQATAVNTPLEIQSIEALFQNAQLVPELIPTFDPTAALHFSFDNVTDNPADSALTITQVSTPPKLTLYPINSTVANDTSMFTLMMVDADVVGTDESVGQTRHWLVNDVTITGDGSPKSLDLDNATAITNYAGPYPAAGSGPHRYCVFLYAQPSSFQPPANLSTPGTPLANNWQFLEYVESTGLELVAGTFYTVEQGTTSSSIPTIPTVVTSTLPAAQSIATASAAGTTTASGSGSGAASAPSGTASASASATAKANSASGHVVRAWGLGGVAALLGVAML